MKSEEPDPDINYYVEKSFLRLLDSYSSWYVLYIHFYPLQLLTLRDRDSPSNNDYQLNL